MWQRLSKSRRGGEEKRNGRLLGAAKTSKELAESSRLQRHNLNKLGLRKKERVASYQKASSWQERKSSLCQIEKEQNHLSRSSDREVGERVNVSKSNTLAREKGIRAGAWEGKGGLHSKGKRVPGRREGTRKRTSLEVLESMSGRVDAKDLQEDQKSLGFTSSLAKPKMEKEIGRQRARSEDDKAK